MAGQNVARLDEIRSINFSGISGTYAPVGSAFEHVVRIICFTNNTDGDLMVSLNNEVDNLFIPAGGFKLFDLTTNKGGITVSFVFPPTTRIFVKQVTAPTSGDFYVECAYARGE